MKRKLLTISTAATVMLGSAPAAFAAPTQTNTISFKSVLPSDNLKAMVPDASISYSITPGAADPAKYVSAGLEGAVLKFKGVGDTNTTTVTYGAEDTVDGFKNGAVAKEVVIDFSGVKWVDPGIYRYVVTLTGVTGDGVSIVDGVNATRTVDVYVTTDEAGQLSIASTVFGVSTDPSYPKEAGMATKSEEMGGTEGDKDPTNAPGAGEVLFTSKDLTVSNTVTGNQGDRDKDFVYKVNIAGQTGEKYIIRDASGAEQIVNANADTTLNLKHKENLVVYGLSANDTYTISQTDEAALGYTTTYDINGAGAVEGLVSTGKITVDTTDAYVNNKEMVVPTGVVTTIAPFAAMVGAAGLLGFAFKKKEDKE